MELSSEYGTLLAEEPTESSPESTPGPSQGGETNNRGLSSSVLECTVHPVVESALSDVSDAGVKHGVQVPVAAKPLHVIFPTSQDLLIFNLKVDVSLKQRFNDILDRIEEPLLKYIQKPRERYQPISVRFGYLGTSERDVKPSIIVFCCEEKSKRVGKFFKKSLAKDLCRPPNGEFPTFEVYVVGSRPYPRLRELDVEVQIATPELALGNRDVETFCGAPIRLLSRGSSKKLYATLGGLIKVSVHGSDPKLFGMTAGHLLENWSDIQESELASDSDDIESDYSSSPEEDTDRNPPQYSDEHTDPWNFSQYHPVNTSIATPTTGPGSSRGRYYDWAVFEVDEARRNLLPAQTLTEQLVGDLIMPREESISSFENPRSVVMLSASGPMRRGSLTDGPSRLLLGPGRALVKTLIFTLGDGHTVVDGDSGSWIVDPESLEVFGHVIASDILGDIYVVPICDAFKDIKKCLNCSSVTLPTADDIRRATSLAKLKVTEDPSRRAIRLDINSVPLGEESADASTVPSPTSSVADSLNFPLNTSIRHLGRAEPPTCLSAIPHEPSDPVQHYLGCLRFEERKAYLESLPDTVKASVTTEVRRILELLAQLQQDADEHSSVIFLRQSMMNWRYSTQYKRGMAKVEGQTSQKNWLVLPDQQPLSEPTTSTRPTIKHGKLSPADLVDAYIIEYERQQQENESGDSFVQTRGSSNLERLSADRLVPIDEHGKNEHIRGHFPSQRISLSHLLKTKGSANQDNLLFGGSMPDRIRYVTSRATGEDYGLISSNVSRVINCKKTHDTRIRLRVANPLGQVLLDAASLYETLCMYRDKLLLERYLHSDPPLHPRRTLDQAYYWTLSTTKVRDRDQVVYRETTPEESIPVALRDSFARYHLQRPISQLRQMNDGDGVDKGTRNWAKFPRDRKDSRHDTASPVPRRPTLLMVDQLWMWILDEHTIITSFPELQDHGGVHKSIRARLGVAREAPVRSVYDLGLVVLDECFNSVFDRPPVSGRQGQKINVIELFTDAIGQVSNQQAILFRQLWHWSERANEIYRSNSETFSIASLQVPLLDISLEGRLLRETKDIIDELNIMLHFMRTQRSIGDKFVKQVEHMLDPEAKWRDSFSSHDWASGRRPPPPALVPRFGTRPVSAEDERRRQQFNWFRTNACDVMCQFIDRIDEVEGLKSAAESAALGLRDLLDLKQQQASIAQAWQAVKLADESANQGCPLTIRTMISLVLLPFALDLLSTHVVNPEVPSTLVSNTLLISLAISTMTLIIAYSTHLRAVILSGYTVGTIWLLVRTGAYKLWLMLKGGGWDEENLTPKAEEKARAMMERVRKGVRKARQERNEEVRMKAMWKQGTK
ncbi:hypothetical protein DL768_009380 [Monosporascus sp. mg162]|nr:hypothetical protein DL768_009380 [Monosporascus sp. mg162]